MLFLIVEKELILWIGKSISQKPTLMSFLYGRLGAEHAASYIRDTERDIEIDKKNLEKLKKQLANM